jgi:hypothetical protein
MDANKRNVLLRREESKAAIATATTPVKWRANFFSWFFFFSFALPLRLLCLSRAISHS